MGKKLRNFRKGKIRTRHRRPVQSSRNRQGLWTKIMAILSGSSRPPATLSALEKISKLSRNFHLVFNSFLSHFIADSFLSDQSEASEIDQSGNQDKTQSREKRKKKISLKKSAHKTCSSFHSRGGREQRKDRRKTIPVWQSSLNDWCLETLWVSSLVWGAPFGDFQSGVTWRQG